MNGKISVESVPGTGSCFEFNLVLATSQAPQILTPWPDLLNNDILIADNDLSSRKVVRQLLEHCGATVVEVDDGNQGLAELERHYTQNNKGYDFILIDSRNGAVGDLPLTTALKQDVRFREIKVISMTDTDVLEDGLLLESGIAANMRKPVMPTELCRAIKHASDGNSGPDKLLEPNPGETPNLFAGKKILLVEDNAINQQVALGILEDMELQIHIAEDGLAAINAMCRSPDDNLYQVILMDCQMPQMDGYQATKEIRSGKAGQRYEQVPILAMTANAMKGDREKCLAAGMDDYIAKPIDPDLLAQKLVEWLSGIKRKIAISTSSDSRHDY